MRILLTNHGLHSVGGSETFTYTLARALARRGHGVTCFSLYPGAVAARFAEGGVVVCSRLEELEEPDVIHGHHRLESMLVRARFPKTPLVLVSHGVLPWQEQPVRSLLGAHRVVAVSEEIQQHLAATLGRDTGEFPLIRNGVDLSRFQPAGPVAQRPRKLLVLSNKMDRGRLEIVRAACEPRGISVEVSGYAAGGEPRWDVEVPIAQADVVVTLGRGVLEALACGRNAIVYDHQGGDGLVTPGNFHELRRKNFSGRTHARQFSAEELGGILDEASPENAAALQALVAAEHGDDLLASNFLQLYEEARAAAAEPGFEERSRGALVTALAEVAHVATFDHVSADDLRRQLSAEQTQAGELRRDLDVTRRDLDFTRREFDSTRQALDGERRELEQARQQMQALRQQVAVGERAFAQLQSETRAAIDELTRRGDELSAQLQQLSAGLIVRFGTWIWSARDLCLPADSSRRALYDSALRQIKARIEDAPQVASQANATAAPNTTSAFAEAGQFMGKRMNWSQVTKK
ncbi:MAG TPA: glycosyltransferase [Myxococcales bacterium]|nr:glycosyltransferase [Myxococcales bacterium]